MIEVGDKAKIQKVKKGQEVTANQGVVGKSVGKEGMRRTSLIGQHFAVRSVGIKCTFISALLNSKSQAGLRSPEK